jgi:stearoyl-CoA desaturase (delta-9 desaturase)
MKKHSSQEINWFVTSILLGLPLFVIIATFFYIYHYGLGKKEIILAVTTYYLANISVGVGLHRRWSHASYKTTKWIEFLLMLLSSGTLQGPVLAWASDHKFHHAYSDTDRDPHTPLKYPNNKIKGFFWSHIGWMLVGDITAKNIDPSTMATLGKSKMLKWQLKNYALIATLMNTVAPLLFGWAIFAEITIQSSLAGLFFVGIGRALQQQMTFCVNSVCHILGSKKYANDSSRDVWWLFFLLLGENWHNFHHAFGNDYRNGHKWYHLDLHKWIIALLAKFGLAWDLVVTPEARIQAKMQEMQSNRKNDLQKTLEQVAILAANLANHAREKLTAASQNFDNFSNKAREKFTELEEAAATLASNIQALVVHSENLTQKLVKNYKKEFKILKKMAQEIGLCV